MSKLIGFSLIEAASVGPLVPPGWASEAGSTESTAFPAEFRGDWYGAPGPCDSDKIALQIGATSLNYFDEFSGSLVRIIRQTDRIVQYVGRYSAEDREWEATETLSLSPNGNEMRLEPERTSSRYFRCTTNKPSGHGAGQ